MLSEGNYKGRIMNYNIKSSIGLCFKKYTKHNSTFILHSFSISYQKYLFLSSFPIILGAEALWHQLINFMHN